MKKRNYKKPNIFIYYFGKMCAKFFSFFVLRLKVEKNELKKAKKPYVVIANHESSIDFFSLLSTIKGRVNMIVSSAYYNTIPIKNLLRLSGVIPKQQFQTSVSDLKKMKSVLDHDMGLVFYPAGLMTNNGISTTIPKSTGKSLKWFGKDVYAAISKGSYLTKPKWGNGYRKGKITLNIVKLFTALELKVLSEDEIYKKVVETLGYDAYQNQIEKPVAYKKGNDITGLENVLYWCPKCGSEFKMKVINKDTLECCCCKNQAKANNYGLLEKVNESDVIYQSPSNWSRQIISNLEKEYANTLNFSISSNCQIKMINYDKRKFETVGTGVITLNNDKFILSATIKDEEKTLEFPVNRMPTLPNVPGKTFDLQDGSVSYRLVLEKPEETIKWVYYTEIINNK